MKKNNILYLCRSNGDLERICAFTYLLRDTYNQFVLVDNFSEPVNVKSFLDIILNVSTLIYFDQLYSPLNRFFFSFLKLYTKLVRYRFKSRVVLHKMYSYFMEDAFNNLLRISDFSLIISDIGEIDQCNNLYTYIRGQFVKRSIPTVAFQTGIHTFHFDFEYLKKRNITKKLFEHLVYYTSSEAKLYSNMFKFPLKQYVMGSISLDQTFLDYFEKQIREEKNTISFFCTNISGIDSSFTREKEMDLNLALLESIIESIQNTGSYYRLIIKPHPRVDINLDPRFKKLKKPFVHIASRTDNPLEIILASEIICSLPSSILFHSMALEKKIISIKMAPYLKSIVSFLDEANLNFVEIGQSISFDCLMSACKDDCIQKEALGGVLDYNIAPKYVDLFNQIIT